MTEDGASFMAAPVRIRAIMGSVKRAGPWEVPPRLEAVAKYGNLELDLREATLPPGGATIEVFVKMGNLEVLVPPTISVEVDVESVAGNVTEMRRRPIDRNQPLLRIVGKVRFGNCEVLTLRPGESPVGGERRHHHHHRHHGRWKEIKAEREMWRDAHDYRHRWHPWWLMARMRRRIFFALAVALGGGMAIGWRLSQHPRWWWIVIALIVLFSISGAFAWRLTRPLIVAVRAARDIGDGKLDTRIDPRAHGGEMRLLATAINDMAEKIQQQLADQRQLLAAVSHELRTPLGHMRVLIETARDRGDLDAPRELRELEQEVLVLDDLVGRLLASSRLEFGNLDRRPLDLGELVADAVTAAELDPELIEAEGDVRGAIDPTLVRRAVANLLDNARVHGGGAVAVRIQRRANLVAIEVDDAGPGVPGDRRADAFRAFVPSSGGGLGLGLALVSRIAVAHGGGAWIEDRPGGGARVGFSIATAA